MQEKEIVFLGSKEIGYRCLEYLLRNSERLNAKVVAVLTNDRSLMGDGPGIKDLCEEFDLPILGSLEELVEGPDVDLLISVQYHEILRARHIEKARDLAVNLHMAPLPEYRGCNQFSFAIIDQVKEFGTTLHQLDKTVDGGPILFEKRFSVPPECFVKQLYQRTFDASVVLFEESIAHIISGNFRAVPQESFLGERSSSFHWRKEINEIKQIQPEWENEKQQRYFRATYFPPFDPPYMESNGEKQPLDMDWYQSL